MGNKSILVLAVVIVLSACGRGQLAPKAYAVYYQEHREELLCSREIDELHFEAEVIPAEMMALREMSDPSKRFDRNEYLGYFDNYRNQVSVLLRIRPVNPETSLKELIATKENYAATKQYLNSGIQADLLLESAGKAYPCSVAHCEWDISLQNAILCVMSFPKPSQTEEQQGDLTLIYNDLLFGNGPLKFNFSNHTIYNFPTLIP